MSRVPTPFHYSGTPPNQLAGPASRHYYILQPAASELSKATFIYKYPNDLTSRYLPLGTLLLQVMSLAWRCGDAMEELCLQGTVVVIIFFGGRLDYYFNYSTISLLCGQDNERPSEWTQAAPGRQAWCQRPRLITSMASLIRTEELSPTVEQQVRLQRAPPGRQKKKKEKKFPSMFVCQKDTVTFTVAKNLHRPRRYQGSPRRRRPSPRRIKSPRRRTRYQDGEPHRRQVPQR